MDTLDDVKFRALQAKPRITGSRVAEIVSIDYGPIVDFPGNPLGPQRARVVASLSLQSLSDALGARLPVLVVFEDDDPARPVVVDIVVDRPFGVASAPPPPLPHSPAANPEVVQRDVPVAIAGRVARIIGIEEDFVLLDGGTEDGIPIKARTTVTLRNLKDPVIVLGFSDGSAAIVGQVYPFVPVEANGAEGADVLLRGTRVTIEADAELILRSGGCVFKLDARGKVVTTADQIVSRARGGNKVQGGSVQLN